MFISLKGKPSELIGNHLSRLDRVFPKTSMGGPVKEQYLPIGKPSTPLPMTLDKELDNLKPSAGHQTIPMQLDNDLKKPKDETPKPTPRQHFDADLEKFPLVKTGEKVPAYHEARSDQVFGGAPKFEQIRKRNELMKTEPVVSNNLLDVDDNDTDEQMVSRLQPRGGGDAGEYHRRILEYLARKDAERASGTEETKDTKEDEVNRERKKDSFETLAMYRKQQRWSKGSKTIADRHHMESKQKSAIKKFIDNAKRRKLEKPPSSPPPEKDTLDPTVSEAMDIVKSLRLKAENLNTIKTRITSSKLGDKDTVPADLKESAKKLGITVTYNMHTNTLLRKITEKIEETAELIIKGEKKVAQKTASAEKKRRKSTAGTPGKGLDFVDL